LALWKLIAIAEIVLTSIVFGSLFIDEADAINLFRPLIIELANKQYTTCESVESAFQQDCYNAATHASWLIAIGFSLLEANIPISIFGVLLSKRRPAY
jgi:hypothetical protein